MNDDADRGIKVLRIIYTAVAAGYRRLAIVEAALTDGPSFLAGAVYMLTGSAVALGAAGVGVALALSRMPSRERLERFAARSREQQ